MLNAVGGDGGTLTSALAEWACGFRYEELSAQQQERLQVLLLDHLACVARGSRLPWGEGLKQWATSYGGSGNATVVGSALRAAPHVAGLLNATAAHGMEFDDTHDPSLTHPGAGVIATALAVAEDTDADGREVLAAITVGYEVTARVGIATGASIMERGFHPTALFGGYGAAAAAARLYGRDARALESAWGLLLSMTGGSMQFSQDPQGTTVKRLHGGYGSFHGILAAQLVGHGIEGPAGAVDGRYGMTKLFGGEDCAPHVLRRSSTEKLAIEEISLKPYPSCRLFHSTIDALREALGELPCDPGEITSITVGAPSVVALQHMMRRPTSMMAAQYSLPFVVAAAIVKGPYSDGAFEPAALSDPGVLSVADKVHCVHDAGMEAAFPRHFGSWAEVEKRDGQRARADRLDSYGTPALPMPIEATRAKASSLFEAAGLRVALPELMNAISRLGDGGRVSDVMRQIGGR